MDDGELKQYFAGRLPARIAEVERARDEARDAGWSGPPLRTLHRLSHSLAGAAATFGFPEEAARARRIEKLLEKGEIGEEAQREIGEILGELKKGS
jgi:HPt (histidine-containing phosphotransfer) domain-containing protein